ncbi:MAG: hypothetical protein ACLFRT_08740 [Actinomycetota bacterium]
MIAGLLVALTSCWGSTAAGSGFELAEWRIDASTSTRVPIDFTCRIVTQDPVGEIVDHFEAGMNATVSVPG